MDTLYGAQKLLKHIELIGFGPVWDGAGVRGFSGEGYWHHSYVPGLSFRGSTFVAKTITTYPHVGNTPLTSSFRPRDMFPKSVHVSLHKGTVVNAVGLSNPGVSAFLATGRWQTITEPFFISYMPILGEEEFRQRVEVTDFVTDLTRHVIDFQTRNLGIQLNISCPNVSADLPALVRKASKILDELSYLVYRERPVPIVVKLNVLVPPETAAEIADHEACTGLCISNSLPFGTVLPDTWWQKYYRRGSPLTKYGFGGGGLSGGPLLKVVEAWLKKFRAFDTRTYVNAGGGILRPTDVDIYRDAGADSIFISSAAILRPWRVQKIIDRAVALF